MAIRATASGRMPGGERWSNVFHFAGATLTVVEGVAITAKLRAFYEALAPILSSQWAVDTLVLQRPETDDAGLEAEWEVLPGTNTNPALPNDMAVVISWKTANRGRSYRGRTYLCGFTTISLGSGPAKATQVVDSHTSQIAGAAEGLAADDVAPELVIYSRKLLTDTVVTGGFVDGVWDTQRRRDKQTPQARVDFLAS